MKLQKIIIPKGTEAIEPKEWELEWDLGVKEVVWGYKGE